MSWRSSIPVIMYHSVGPQVEGWRWSFLTVPPQIFEDQLRWLQRKGYQTIDLYQLYDHVSGVNPLVGNHVVLTFDDGYLDNWTHVAPLLRKYGFKATVYVNPEFVDPCADLRPSMEDVWQGRRREPELETRGFMSWAELRRISDEGVFSVQSHLMTHTWYPVGDKIVDFHHPGDEYYWLDWNTHPDRKTHYLREIKGRVPYGFPVYENAKSVIARKYYPDPAEAEHLVGFVKSNGGDEFFKQGTWQSQLMAEAEEYRMQHRSVGRIETEDEYMLRLEYELKESRTILEDRLGKAVDFLAWPGGGYDERSVDSALGVYKAVTLGSRDRSGARNRPGENPRLEKRCGVPYVEKDGVILYQDGRYLYHYLREFQGSKLHRVIRKGLQVSSNLYR